MANVINATSTGNGGLVSTGDDSGILNIQTNETTAITVDASQKTTLVNDATISGLTVGKGGASVSTNTAFGVNALAANNGAGYSNTATGMSSLLANTSGYVNTAFGYNSLSAMTTGAGNTAIGESAGKVAATGNNSTFVGQNGSASGSANSHEILIGCNTTGKGSNTGFIQPNGGGVYQGNNSSSWSTTSDRRLKKNIVDNTEGLDLISQIRVRNFEYRTAEEVTELPAHTVIEKEGVQLGVIAQELQEVCPDCIKEESTGVISVDSDNIFWHMVNAIKDLKAINDTQAETINALTARIVALEGQ
jgi:hypothetical protein